MTRMIVSAQVMDSSGIGPGMGSHRSKEAVIGQGNSAVSSYCYAPVDELTAHDEQMANWILSNSTSGIHPILAEWTFEAISRVLA